MEVGHYLTLNEAISMLDNPTFIELMENVNEASFKADSGYPGDSKKYISVGGTFTDSPGRAMPGEGPGAPGTLGYAVRSQLSSLGQGFGVQVADFGEAVTVTITYSNPKTCKNVSQSFVLVYHGKNAKNIYTVYANSARWCNCNDYSQAISFIRSKASYLTSAGGSAI